MDRATTDTRARWRARLLAFVLALALALALPATPALAAGWLPDAAFSPTGAPPQQAALAFDPGGGLEVVASSGAGPFFGLDRFDRPLGAAWPAAASFSSSDQPPVVAVDSTGNALALSSTQAGLAAVTDAIVGYYRTAGGTWDAGTNAVAGANPYVNGAPALAFLPDGTAVAAVPTVNGVKFASRPPGAMQPWSAAAVTTTACNSGCAVSVAVDPAGDAMFLWTQTNTAAPGANDGVYSVVRSAAGAYGAPQQIVAGLAGTIAPRIGLSAGGDAVAVWTSGTSIRYSTRPAATGVWAANAAVSAAVATSPDLAVDPGGNAIVSWIAYEASSASFNTVQSAYRPAGGAWSSAQTIGTGPVAHVESAPDASFWLIRQTGGGGVDVRRAAPGSPSFDAPTQLVADGSGAKAPVLAFDPSGDAAAIWNDGAAFHSRIYDAVAPTLSIGGPASLAATAGAPVEFTATDADGWGPVTVSWDFGDGAAGSGSPVAHTYTTPGTYTARAVAADGAGNTSSQTQTVTVAATPAPPPVITPPPSTLPAPVLGKLIDVYVLKDPVFYKLPRKGKHGKFKRLIKQAQVPNGTVINARRGRVLVVIDNGHGGQDSAQFYGGVFEVNQPRRLKGLANIFLDGGGFKGCAKAPKDPHAQLSRKKASKHRSVRHLWASGHGKFRTVGRFSSATIRGTKWLTDDRCDGTLTRVRGGKVAVRDFVKRKTVVVRAHHRYFARPRR